MSIFQKISSYFSMRHTFDDGTRLESLHRYALRYFDSGKCMDIGFEIGVKSKVDRVIHYDTIRTWNTPDDAEPVTEEMREAILKKVISYCEARRWSFRVSDGPE